MSSQSSSENDFKTNYSPPVEAQPTSLQDHGAWSSGPTQTSSEKPNLCKTEVQEDASNSPIEQPDESTKDTETSNQKQSSTAPEEDNPSSDSQSLANLTCSICLSPPSPLVVTKCGHVACGECLAASFASQHHNSFGPFHQFFPPRQNQINNGKCPVCRASLIGGWGNAMRGAILKMGKSS